MTPVAILYNYFGRNRPVVEQNYSRLVADNPGVPVVPIVHQSEPWIDGTIDVACYESVWITENEQRGVFNKPDEPKPWSGFWWAHCDQIFWRYLRSPNRVEAERYVVFEWDTLSHGMSVEEFYDDVWDADMSVMSIRTVEKNPEWMWFERSLEVYYGANWLRGGVPFCGTTLSREAADLVARTDPPCLLRKATAELFAATYCNISGLEVVENTKRSTMLGTYGTPGLQFNKDVPGIYHPVTYLVSR